MWMLEWHLHLDVSRSPPRHHDATPEREGDDDCPAT